METLSNQKKKEAGYPGVTISKGVRNTTPEFVRIQGGRKGKKTARRTLVNTEKKEEMCFRGEAGDEIRGTR